MLCSRQKLECFVGGGGSDQGCVCLPGGVDPGGVHPRGVCPRGVCPRGMSAAVHAGIHIPLSAQGVSAPVHTGIHTPLGQNDRRLWKYYLAATKLRTVNMAEKNYILLRQLYFVDWRTEGLYSDSKKIALAYPLWKVIPLNATTQYSCCKSNHFDDIGKERHPITR